MSTRLLIVDDSARFLDAARELLEREGLDIVAVAETGDEAARLVGELRPDCVLVDFDLGPENGLDVARQLTGEHGVAVVLISAYSASELADLIVGSPALGFLSKVDLSASRVMAILDGQQPNERGVGALDE